MYTMWGGYNSPWLGRREILRIQGASVPRSIACLQVSFMGSKLPGAGPFPISLFLFDRI